MRSYSIKKPQRPHRLTICGPWVHNPRTQSWLQEVTLDKNKRERPCLAYPSTGCEDDILVTKHQTLYFQELALPN
jgi:hypothetical protein